MTNEDKNKKQEMLQSLLNDRVPRFTFLLSKCSNQCHKKYLFYLIPLRHVVMQIFSFSKLS